jgi:hypothetical protein
LGGLVVVAVVDIVVLGAANNPWSIASNLYCCFISGVIYSALYRNAKGFRNSLKVSLMFGSGATCFGVPVRSSLITQLILSLSLLSNSVLRFSSLNSRM